MSQYTSQALFAEAAAWDLFDVNVRVGPAGVSRELSLDTAGLLAEMDPAIDRYLSPGSLRDAGLFDPPKTGMLVNKLRRSRHASEVDNMALAGILSSQMIYDQFVSAYSAGTIPLLTPDVLIDRRTSARGK